MPDEKHRVDVDALFAEMDRLYPEPPADSERPDTSALNRLIAALLQLASGETAAQSGDECRAALRKLLIRYQVQVDQESGPDEWAEFDPERKPKTTEEVFDFLRKNGRIRP